MDTQTDFLNPDRECDLVMKGGITSGIVYPRVVLRLASEGKYRFRNVGGTSAGAIAAALTAAAEFGRETGGFQRFEEMSKQLAESGFLFNLFQPAPRLKPLMYTLLELLNKIPPDAGLDDRQVPVQPKSQPAEPAKAGVQSILNPAMRLIGILRRRNPKVANAGAKQGLLLGLGVALLLTAIAAIVFYVASLFTNTDFSIWAVVSLFILFSIPFGFLGYSLGVLGFGAIDVVNKLTQEVPRNFFGVCVGRSDPHDPDNKRALTDWLSSEIDRISGIAELNQRANLPSDRPLTFGDLQAKKVENGQNVGIILKTVTSNLSQNQPYTMPFEPGHLFLFNEDEFRQFFPPNVVEHLKRYAGERPNFQLSNQSRYHFLPDPTQMPIVVAMRMSLSFPLLISAVPLYTIKQSATAKQSNVLNESTDLQRNWFSDGGICSNFPIHFFDAWLPSRPTFGINLASVSEDALPAGHLSSDNLAVTPNTLDTTQKLTPGTALQSRENVYLPNVGDMLAPEWVDLKENLPGFIWQIFLTSQNYRDTMQSYLPGYRERIAQVRLTDSEGGLNLAMDNATIQKVMEKGEQAGILLNNFDFKCHKWIRLRVLLGLLDEKLREMHFKALKDNQFHAAELIDEAQRESFPFAYSSEDQADKAKFAIDRIKDSVEKVWLQQESLNEGAPQPKSVLRTTPEF
ncbi:MAG TPA: patatin-like phospholipase family protein [Trichocoleus sp.]|jgi:predicted acylesterase/phospholipase RssA